MIGKKLMFGAFCVAILPLIFFLVIIEENRCDQRHCRTGRKAKPGKKRPYSMVNQAQKLTWATTAESGGDRKHPGQRSRLYNVFFSAELCVLDAYLG